MILVIGVATVSPCAMEFDRGRYPHVGLLAQLPVAQCLLLRAKGRLPCPGYQRPDIVEGDPSRLFVSAVEEVIVVAKRSYCAVGPAVVFRF